MRERSFEELWRSVEAQLGRSQQLMASSAQKLEQAAAAIGQARLALSALGEPAPRAGEPAADPPPKPELGQ